MGRATWELVLEAATALTRRGMVEFSRASLLDEVLRLDPARLPQSLGPVIQGMTVNATGGPPSPCGTPLQRLSHGVYRLVDPALSSRATAEPAAAPPMRSATPVVPGPPRPRDPVDIVLVGCVKTKLDHAAPARLLYRSTLFDRRREYAQTRARTWYVISAEHGLVHPDALLDPYDVALADQPDDYRRAWAGWVAAKLQKVEGDLRGRHIEIHAGQAYATPLLPLLRALGAHVAHPVAGLRRGEQLAWYEPPGDVSPAALSPVPSTAPPTAAPPTEPPTVPPASTPAASPEPEPADSWLSNVTVIDGPHDRPGFTYRWPDATETFESSTELTLMAAGTAYRMRVGTCDREAYGQARRRIVVFAGTAPLCEAVGADDYPRSRVLLGLLKHADGRMVRPGDPVPQEYAGFPLVDFADEVSGPYTRAGLAVRLREDDYVSWAAFALARKTVRAIAQPAPDRASTPARPPPPPVAPPVPAQTRTEQAAVVAALLRFGREHWQDQERIGGDPQFTPHPQANRLIIDDPFAFLLAVIFDQGIPAERAWRAPYELRLRLGHLDPARMVADPAEVRAAVMRRPSLHRYVEKLPRWLVFAAERLIAEYGGSAGAIWGDNPRAVDLMARLRAFHGISQKKSAMAVEILARDLNVPVRDLTGSDIAYDVHVRRVFLRTRLAAYDDQDHMVEVARRLHPERPGELDAPAWLIGRQWCGAGTPDCAACPLAGVCPRDILRAATVTGS